MADTKLLPAYLVLGADELKRDVVINRLKTRLEKTGLADFNLDERDMTRSPAIDDIVASLNTLPLGADFRLVVLHGCDHLPKDTSEPLVSYLANPSPTTVCLFIAQKLAKNMRLYKAIAALDPQAVIDCTPKKAWEMPTQVIAMARGYGKTMDQEAAKELIDRAGDNARLLDNELKRLAQQVDGPDISLADVKRLVVRTAEAKPWDLLDAVSAKDTSQALQQLTLQPSKSEIRLYTLLVGRIRELIVAKSLDARGQGHALAATLKVQPWQVKNHLVWAQRWTTEQLVDALRAAVDVELALKGSRDSDLALRTWIVQICQD